MLAAARISEGEEGGEEADSSDEAAGTGVAEITWEVPSGFTVADEPAMLDVRLVGKSVYMRWEKFGWQLGKIYEQITRSTPRLYAKFNYRIVWSDGARGPAKLAVDNYAFGEHAAYSSWVILSPEAQAEL